MTLPTSTPKTFNFETHDVRTFEKHGEVWFAAKDVCDALALGNSRQAMTRLDEDEKDGVITNDAMSREQTLTVVNESGLYSLILTSRKPEAQRFKRWVTHEVLPSIRQTGSYVDAAAVTDMAASRLVDTRFLVSFRNGTLSMQPVSSTARVVDVQNEKAVARFINDEIPVSMVVKMIEAGTRKLHEVIESQRGSARRLTMALPQN